MEEYKKLLEKLLNDIDAIDNDTPWQEVEPKWWLSMMDFQSYAIRELDGMNHIDG